MSARYWMELRKRGQLPRDAAERLVGFADQIKNASGVGGSELPLGKGNGRSPEGASATRCLRANAAWDHNRCQRK
jgi:hypothetical protein